MGLENLILRQKLIIPLLDFLTETLHLHYRLYRSWKFNLKLLHLSDLFGIYTSIMLLHSLSYLFGTHTNILLLHSLSYLFGTHTNIMLLHSLSYLFGIHTNILLLHSLSYLSDLWCWNLSINTNYILCPSCANVGT